MITYLTDDDSCPGLDMMMGRDSTTLVFTEDTVDVWHKGKVLASIPLGVYRLVRPDHDAMILGKATSWRREGGAS